MKLLFLKLIIDKRWISFYWKQGYFKVKWKIYQFRSAQALESIGVNKYLVNIILIIAFLAVITLIDYLIVSCEKCGMVMVSMSKVSTNFAISYVAGIIPPVYS